MPMLFDLVVVGASFAGLACARAAALAGASVLVLEKKTSSGDKLHTTGIIVKDAVDSNPWLREVPSALVRNIEGVRLYAPNLRHIDLHAPGYYFWATDTPALLDWMVQSVQALGVCVRHDSLFENAQQVGALWQVVVRGEETIQARYLVGADGPHSRVAKALLLSRNTRFLYGVEHEYGQVDIAPNLLHCFINQRLAPGYIGWAVPGVGMTQIGLARRMAPAHTGQPPVNLEHLLAAVVPHVKPHGAALAVRAGMIPCGGVLQRVACAGAMLVGDAAGMVSPVTAGGIHTALKHGHAIGTAVAAYTQGKASDPAQWMPAEYPRYRIKRALRWCFDHLQADWVFNLMLKTPAMRSAAERVYFHRKGAIPTVSAAPQSAETQP